MMVTAMGADHTVGNIPNFKCEDKTTEELVESSLDIQIACAVADSLGLCLFGRSVTNVSGELVATALNNACGTDYDESFLEELGLETLRMEWEFNKAAGFTEEDDELPDFFYDEGLLPKGKKARHHAKEVNAKLREMIG
jgi:aldehyde:ferredoxin oxidoreductase